MDTTPIYELRERLRAAAIAGTSLLSEDFRLRRACEAFRPLEAASPVFAKLEQMTAQLLSPDCSNPQGALLDTLTLTDAVICTLGTVEVQGMMEPADILEESTGGLAVKIPCSKLKTLIESLTTSGSGNYSYVCDMRVSNPEIFEDYRVKYAMVQALGAAYAELAEMVKGWLEEGDETWIPLLKKGFDPRGKMSMVRRVQVIEKIAGAAENEFYIKMLESAVGEVRAALIEALRHTPANIELLIDMYKTERGKNKQLVLNMLSMVEDARCYEIFQELAKKKQPFEVCSILYPSTTDAASRVVAALCDRQFSDLLAIPPSERKSVEADRAMSTFCLMIKALVGKHGETVCECYRKLLLHLDVLEHTGNSKPMIDILGFSGELRRKVECWSLGELRLDGLGEYHFPVRSRKFSWEVVIGSLMAQSLVVWQDKDLMKMALEYYEKDKNVNFLTAAVIVKILGREDCTEWLEENAAGEDALNEMERAFVCFSWNRRAESYVVDMKYEYIPGDRRSSIFRKVEIPQARKIADWMMRHRGHATDAILNRWIDTRDSKECEKYGKYFYERALTIVDNEEYLRYMRNCGWKQCKGLGTDYARIKVRNDSLWKFNNYLQNLPGDEQAIVEEISAVIDLVWSGKVELMELDTPERIEKWAEQLKDLSFYYALKK